MEGAAYRLAIHGLLSLLAQTTQHHLPRGNTAYSGLSLLTTVINQERALQSCLRPILRRWFLNGESLVPNNSSCDKLTINNQPGDQAS